jgi:N-acetylneuraminic acid mutarotase
MQEIPNYPGKRARHAAVLWEQKMIMICGQTSGLTNTNKVEAYDLEHNRWSRVSLTRADKNNVAGFANSFPSIDSHTAALLPGSSNVLVFGGFIGDDAIPSAFTWNIDLQKQTIERVMTKGRAPKPRGSHAAAVLGTKMYIFGGSNGSERFNDLWVLDLGTSTWTSLNKIYPTGDPKPQVHRRNLLSDMTFRLDPVIHLPFTRTG